MNDICHQLHQFVNGLNLYKHPFTDDYMPMNGIYFFFEQDEYAHGGRRIVRVGTHRGRHKLRSRLEQHFVYERSFQKDFRLNILDALTYRQDVQREDLLASGEEDQVWSHSDALTHIRDCFSFAVLPVEDRQERLQTESRIIGTIAHCKACGPSESWLGKYSPNGKIRTSGLWQTQQLGKPPLSDRKLKEIIASYAPPDIPEFDDPLLRLVAHHLYAVDGRNRQPGAYTGRRLSGRQNTFLQSFYKACRGERMKHEQLAVYTWSNLGWRLGAILRAVSKEPLTEDEQRRYGELLFRVLTHLYKTRL